MASEKPGLDWSSAESEARKQLEAGILIKKGLQHHAAGLVSIAMVMTSAFQHGGKVLIFGNGGSAADALHIAGELAGRMYIDRPPLPALALTANTSVVTAISNDFSYEDVFTRQVQFLTRPGDVVIGISTSGRSRNVILAVKEAKRLGAVTVGFTGLGQTLRKMVDHALIIPSRDTPRIQEGYMAAAHIICSLVEKALFSEER